MSFIDDTRLSAMSDMTYVASLSPAWRSMLDIHGGYVAAIAARAVEIVINDPDRALRSFTVQFVRPAHPGQVTIAIEPIKVGRTATFLRAIVSQDERTILTATAIAGANRGGLSFCDVSPPPAALTAPPDDADRFTGSDSVIHFEQLDLRLEPGLTMFEAHDRAHVAGWIRPLAPAEPITLPWMVCAADFMPPAMVFRTGRLVQAASIDMAVQLICSDAGDVVGPGGRIYADANCAISAEGFSVEDATFWASSGQLLATSRQVRLAGTESTPNPLQARS